MSNLIAGIPNEVYRKMAKHLWASRWQSVWWTKDEGGTYNMNDLNASSKRQRILESNSCIQCHLEARYSEESVASRVFCGSYCQWMNCVGERAGFPDLRGMSPAEVERAMKESGSI